MDRRQFKATSLFLIYQQLIDSEIESLKTYINETSEELVNKQQDLTESFNAATAAQDHDDEFDAHTIFESDIEKYFRKFPTYTYNSILLIIYGLFENWLKKLCELDHRKELSRIKVTHLAGNNYIDKSHTYLTLIANLQIDKNDPNWKKIIQIQKLRNCIAHNDSNIWKTEGTLESQELFQFANENTSIELDLSNGEFYISNKEFLLDVLDLIKKYIQPIINSLDNRRVVAKSMNMPYDNTYWGQQKTKSLIGSVISGLNLLDKNEERTDEFKDSDLKFNLRSTFTEMAVNLTKIYSFFCAGDWSVKDVGYIISEREQGLKTLDTIYHAYKSNDMTDQDLF